MFKYSFLNLDICIHTSPKDVRHGSTAPGPRMCGFGMMEEWGRAGGPIGKKYLEFLSMVF